MVAQCPKNEIGIDLNNMIIPELLNQAVPDQSIRLVDQNPVLVRLRNRRVVLALLCHKL